MSLGGQNRRVAAGRRRGTIFLDEDLADVAQAAHEVVEQAKKAGVWVFGSGVKGNEVSVVATDGSVSDGPSPEHLGGFAIVPLADRPVRSRAHTALSDVDSKPPAA